MSQTENSCPIEMSDDKPCGRPAVKMATPEGLLLFCNMHSPASGKRTNEFQEEIKAILNGTSDYHRTKHLDFTGFVFPTYDFSDVTFGEGASFYGAKFGEGTSFYWAKFGEGANFDGADFGEGAGFFGAEFGLEANFWGAKFGEGASFQEAKFGEGADFGSADFGEGADFNGAEFGEGANFNAVDFGKGPTFQNAKFGEGVNFSTVSFGEGANFWRAKFGEGANFDGADFGEGANFNGADFGEGADFNGADFGEGAGFLETTFQGVVSFRNVYFENPANFYRVNHTHQDGFLVRFLNCDMREVVFEDIHWHRLNGRIVLQDELDVTEPEANKGKNKEEETAEPESRYELVAIAYRRLVHNFENVRAYDLAEDCYVGAMEMKRLDPTQPWSARLVSNIYRLASYYGSNYAHALKVLILLLLGFALSFSLVWATLLPNTASFLASGNPGIKGLVHSFEVATFQRGTVFVTTTWIGWLLEIVERVVVPSQLAFFLLALRRRFKR